MEISLSLSDQAGDDIMVKYQSHQIISKKTAWESSALNRAQRLIPVQTPLTMHAPLRSTLTFSRISFHFVTVSLFMMSVCKI